MVALTDIDIDVANREKFLELIPHINASIRKPDADATRHNVGIYLQNIPTDPFTGMSNIDYKLAEELGYFKIDILNVAAYGLPKVKTREQLEQLLNQEPVWEILQDPELSSDLFQLGSELAQVALNKIKPKSVEELAMVLAAIRPSKRYLLDKPIETVRKEIWNVSSTDKFAFKKAHSISYALAIVVQMNLLVNGVTDDDEQS